MDIKAFLDRTRRSKADLLRELGRDPKSSVIGAYISGRSNPSFEIVEKLIELGMTAKEIFGKELGEILISNSISANQEKNFHVKELIQTPEFQTELVKALAELKTKEKRF